MAPCAALTVRSTSARCTENESHPSSATGRTPVRARKENRRARNDMSWLLVVVPRRRPIRPLLDSRAALERPSISRRGRRTGVVWEVVLSALRMSGERQVLFQQALDAAELVQVVRLPRGADLVQDLLSREQDLAPSALARDQAREQLQASGPQVFGRLPHPGLEDLDWRIRIRFVGANEGAVRVVEQAEARHRGGALDFDPDLLDGILDASSDEVEV